MKTRSSSGAYPSCTHRPMRPRDTLWTEWRIPYNSCRIMTFTTSSGLKSLKALREPCTAEIPNRAPSTSFPKNPTIGLKTKVYGEYGNYNSIRAGANISGPVVDDTLYMGGAVLYRSSDGYVTNEYNGDDKAGEINKKNGRATIRWTPTDQWDISLIADAMEADDHAGYYRYVTGPYATDPHKTNKDDSNYLKENGNSQILQVGYGGDAIDVKSITGVLYRWREKYSDSDLSTNPKARTTNRFQWDLHQYSQELRFSSAQGGPLSMAWGSVRIH